MTKRIENADKVLMENAFFEKNRCGCYGWFGLEYFEIDFPSTGNSIEDLKDLRDCIDAMIAEKNRIEG